MSAQRSTRSEVLGAISAGLIVVAFCLILLWHNPLVFWNDDYELSVLPVFADMARSWSEDHWPILSPYSWVCGNLAGEFQYGVFSAFVNAVVIVVGKFPFTFPQQAAAVSIAHVFALAVGAFLLARDRKFSISLSIFVALVASLNGWVICWGATDWFGALDAVSSDCMAGNQIVDRNSKHFLGLVDAVWRGTRFRIIRSGVARDS